MRSHAIQLIILLAILCLSACDSGAEGQGTTGSSRCTPGDSKACMCTSGGQGAKTCGDDERWDACSCAAPVDIVQPDGADKDGVQPEACEPGQTQACACADGSSSAMICESSGAWGVCQCACEPDCWGKGCGDDGCGGDCGDCPPGFHCEAGACLEGGCDPACVDKDCGPDGCNGSCGTCPQGYECNDWGKCLCMPACGGPGACGDDGCGGTCGSCDAGFACMDGWCVPSGGCEPACPPEYECVDGACVAPWECDPPCPPGFSCMDGECVCEPDCYGKECGDDGCGELCGACPGFNSSCSDWGECVCEPDCWGKDCGSDGCGGTCGTCWEGVCDNGECEDWSPGQGSRVYSMFIPRYPEDSGSTSGLPGLNGSFCLDVDGDGQVDNGLGAVLDSIAGFGVDANAEIAAQLESEDLNLLLDFDGSGLSSYGPYMIMGYYGIATGYQSYEIGTDSFNDSGGPLIALSGANTDWAGHVTAGPSDLGLPLSFQGLPMNLTLGMTRFAADLTNQTEGGVAFEDGAIGGAIYKADIALAVEAAQLYCESSPSPPPECDYMGMVNMSLIETMVSFDLDLPGCGKVYEGQINCQAVSLCVFLAGSPASISGMASGPAMPDCGTCRFSLSDGAFARSLPAAFVLIALVGVFLAVQRRREG
jgi:hypothetical protein